jgi:hypothetical protein
MLTASAVAWPAPVSVHDAASNAVRAATAAPEPSMRIFFMSVLLEHRRTAGLLHDAGSINEPAPRAPGNRRCEA